MWPDVRFLVFVCVRGPSLQEASNSTLTLTVIKIVPTALMMKGHYDYVHTKKKPGRSSRLHYMEKPAPPSGPVTIRPRRTENQVFRTDPGWVPLGF